MGQGGQAETLAHFDAELVKEYIRYLQRKPKWSERGYASSSRHLVSASAIRNSSVN